MIFQKQCMKVSYTQVSKIISLWELAKNIWNSMFNCILLFTSIEGLIWYYYKYYLWITKNH